jgi:hypothetical protein
MDGAKHQEQSLNPGDQKPLRAVIARIADHQIRRIDELLPLNIAL